MSLETQFFTLASIHLFAIIVPGLDFAMVVRNVLAGNRMSGIATSAGLAVGVLVHVCITLMGLSLLISSSPWLYDVIRSLGGAFLVFMGTMILYGCFSKNHQPDSARKLEKVTPLQGFKIGLVTNLTNPKVILFFVGVFSQIIEPTAPAWFKVLCGAEISLATFAFYALISVFVGRQSSKSFFQGLVPKAEFCLGLLIMTIGVSSFVDL
jgi:threonine/homoserine/homoserine lactone efflux protein